MKYVALLSGGKDSCFNLVHCSRNGHELVAAASLGPEQGKEELDSYLYQTVGQDAIELVARALDVPLYKKSISGSAIEQGSEYGERKAGNKGGVKGDETEDLYELLSEVKSQHPDVQGVAVGAILSNYQRVRVEHVCLRLSLTPLCYLWQRNQDELLQEIINTGVDAILIKVAGIGLTPKHLGKTLPEMYPTLKRLNNLYGAHICGEGGEYETLTLDCPMFKQRLVLKDVETVIHSDNDFATVAYLRIKDAFLGTKELSSDDLLPVPSLLDKEFDIMRTVLAETSDGQTEKESPLGAFTDEEDTHTCISTSSTKFGKWVVVSNVQREAGGTNISVAEEVVLCFQLLGEHLSRHALSFSHLTFVNIFISDMSTFPEVNKAYKTFFGTSPPARACVAVDLPTGLNVRLDCIAFAEESQGERRALHVQSLSYWAPANIGPYSQAVIVGERIFISGQIGMLPSTLALPEPADFALETALSFQHVHRIMILLQETYGAAWRPATQCLLCWLVDALDVPRLQRIDEAGCSYASVPTLFIGAKSLPKGAQVEAQVVVHTGQYTATEDGETEVRPCGPPIYDKGDVATDECNVHWEMSSFTEVSAFCAILTIKGNPTAAGDLIKAQTKAQSVWSHPYSVRLFHKGALHGNERLFVDSLLSKDACPAITEVPARFIGTRTAGDWDFALCLIGSSLVLVP